MALPNLDPRTGGGCLRCMSQKFVSVIVGWVQLVIWVIGFLTLVFKPSSAMAVVKNANTSLIVMTGFLTLICIGFSVILLIGLHKDRRLFVKTYLIFVVVYMVLIVLSFFINIFLQPENIGFRGFFALVFSFFLKLVFFLVIRSYYLLAHCSGSNQLTSNEFKA